MLDTLVYLVNARRDVWLEITTLLIPDNNDSDDELAAMCEWIARELGPDVPLHFTAFHPDYKLTDLPAHAGGHAGARARDRAARRAPVRVHRQRARPRRRHDVLPGCAQPLIVRDWHDILRYRVTDNGHCRALRARAARPVRAVPQHGCGRRRVPCGSAMA